MDEETQRNEIEERIIGSIEAILSAKTLSKRKLECRTLGIGFILHILDIFMRLFKKRFGELMRLMAFATGYGRMRGRASETFLNAGRSLAATLRA